MISLDGLWWLLILLGPLLFVQRRLHLEVQAVFLLLTRRVDISLALFSILFFPGVLLHEVSHYLMAAMLRVPTGRFSIIPRPLEDGHIQLGFVETARTDIIRDAFIGAAPLLAGGIFVAYAGIAQLGLQTLWDAILEGDSVILFAELSALVRRPDFWLWLYLTLAVSSTMMPSRSDRRAWIPLAFIVVLLLGLSILAGAGPWMLQNLAPALNQVLRAMAVVLGISLAIQMVLVIPFLFLRRLLVRLTGYNVI